MEHRELASGNKSAWEEAFDRRTAEWGRDRILRLRTERLPFLDLDLAEALRDVDLRGKAVGQFCCNDGRELLSVVMAGASSGVGFDIAENMVAYAAGCAEELGAPCRFVATDVLAIGDGYDDAFDIVLVTIGALSWFADPAAFFRVVARTLKPGGTLYLHDMHPATGMLGAEGEPGFDPTDPLRCVHSYFRRDPWIENHGMGYLTGGGYESKPFTSFSYTFADLVGALVGNGIAISSLLESDVDISGLFGGLDHRGVPLSYLLIGRRGRMDGKRSASVCGRNSAAV